MAKTDFRTVNQYIAAQPKNLQVVLRRVRKIILEAVPGAVEGISYQIPVFKMPAGSSLFLGGWKEHYSLYPASDALVAAFKSALTPYRVSKGTLRFPLSEPVPAQLIARIARFQAKGTARRATDKLPIRKKKSR